MPEPASMRHPPPTWQAASNISWSARAVTPRSTFTAATTLSPSPSIERRGRSHRAHEAGPVAVPLLFVSLQVNCHWVGQMRGTLNFGLFGVVALAAALNPCTTPLRAQGIEEKTAVCA